MDNFKLLGWQFRKSDTAKKIKAPYIAKENDDAAFIIGQNYYGHNIHQLSLDQTFETENELIRKYRDIALHPEVDAAITDIVNEAIVGDNESAPVEIVLDDLEQKERIKTLISDEFEHIIRLLDFNNRAYEIFRKWYVDGRSIYHIIINDNAKKKGIEELRYISPLHIKKVREEVKEAGAGGVEIIESFEEYYIYSRDMHKSKSVGIRISTDSIIYANSGLVDEEKNVVYSHLHKALKPTNQLRMLEDATIIYRLARAPERRVFYVDVGNLPKNKAEEYLRGIMNKYQNKMVYDAVSGEVKDNKNTLSMMEDFWMPRREGGRGTEVTTLQGGQNLGEIADVEYFQGKLYQSLNVPTARLMSEGGGGFNIGRSSEITRDEIKYSKFISRIRKDFSDIFYELLKTQLLLKQIITEDEWKLIKEDISFNFLSDTFFKELKDAEILRERVGTLNEIREYVGSYFSMEYIRKEILKMTDDDIKLMKEQMDKEKKEEPEMIAKFEALLGTDEEGAVSGPEESEGDPEREEPKKDKAPTET